MVLQFKNKHVFFALEGIWDRLHYKFKYQINQLVAANSDEDFMQSVEIDAPTLALIYRDVSAKPEGVAKAINQEMSDSLAGQLMAISNLEAVQSATEDDPVEPNEAAVALIEIAKLEQQNVSNLQAKLLNGKTQILE